MPAAAPRGSATIDDMFAQLLPVAETFSSSGPSVVTQLVQVNDSSFIFLSLGFIFVFCPCLLHAFLYLCTGLCRLSCSRSTMFVTRGLAR